MGFLSLDTGTFLWLMFNQAKIFIYDNLSLIHTFQVKKKEKDFNYKKKIKLLNHFSFSSFSSLKNQKRPVSQFFQSYGPCSTLKMEYRRNNMNTTLFTRLHALTAALSRLEERIKDHGGRDKNSHVLRHSLENSYQKITMENVQIMNKNY